ncbi:response regulator transcription factor [Roseateles depolymerans]|uniref:Histidine kinase n=1 Tax=Roseateles depolymerans TaxID=76731 RepID=A0A0U2TYQ3_9BURK|nr:response regulator [Roseateles depolymerans]ALV05297.1 histidine kinase [Roseateles depolymerans]REG14687.1 LuxR family two component transcriptional regulator [Roseateles depolymerans]
MTDIASTVHLVDDEAAVRDALAFLMRSHGLKVSTHASGPELLDALEKEPDPMGCIVLDVRMEPLSGLQVQDELMRRGVKLPVIFLSGHGDIPMAVDAMQKGAIDFVEKPFNDQALVNKVQRALALDTHRHREAVAHADAAGRLASLTDREREVALRVAAGKLNKQVADELGIAIRTVEVHRARAFTKLGLRSAAELATLLERFELK